MFKNGDIVVFKASSDNDDLKKGYHDIVIGKTYKVIEVTERYIIINNEGKNESFFPSRFEKVTREEKLKRILK